MDELRERVAFDADPIGPPLPAEARERIRRALERED